MAAASPNLAWKGTFKVSADPETGIRVARAVRGVADFLFHSTMGMTFATLPEAEAAAVRENEARAATRLARRHREPEPLLA